MTRSVKPRVLDQVDDWLSLKQPMGNQFMGGGTERFHTWFVHEPPRSGLNGGCVHCAWVAGPYWAKLHPRQPKQVPPNWSPIVSKPCATASA